MFKLISKSNWLAGALIFFMPITLILFLGSQMAYGQVKGKFDAYQSIPEITTAAELANTPAGQVIILRGQMSGDAFASGLIVYQERPAQGREVRFREEFSLVFPQFDMKLPGGQVSIIPSASRERVIQRELHTVAVGDRQLAGFGPGDVVSVQGEWQPAQASLIDTTGITGATRQELLAEWQSAFGAVSWARNILGLVTLVSLVLLIIQLRRSKKSKESSEEWQTPTTTTTPTI